ncbi:MAG: nitroreductase family deazaflavin-dependent oxidoreductase [Anaerolineales bacterium]|nr:nitroreductase family deazaflavin-dependent oxidoreductase [Anaerolineales bacterium]
MWYNPIVTAILRSPFHGLMSGAYVLVSFQGRRSGETYTTPVQYKRSGDTLAFVTRRKRRWWRNLQSGAPVALWLQGRARAAQADVLTGPDEAVAAEIVRIYAPLFTPERAAAMAPESVVVTLRLGDSNL